MSSTARRAAAALLCAVVIGALGLAVMSLPSQEAAPERLDVALDFDVFVPGHTQIRRATVDVPVPSSVARAGIVSTDGGPSPLDVEFTLCDRSACAPFREGATVEPGTYTLNVSATLVAGTLTDAPRDARPVVASGAPVAAQTDGQSGGPTDTASATERTSAEAFTGQLLLVENNGSALTEPRVLIGIAAIGVAVIALAAATLQHRRGVYA